MKHGGGVLGFGSAAKKRRWRVLGRIFGLGSKMDKFWFGVNYGKVLSS